MDKVFELDVAGVLEGTDKSSAIRPSWDYLRHYQPFFEPFRHEPINLIEIGIGQGTSLKLWKYFFPRATIIGVDIRSECTRFEEDRVLVKIGSQDDPGFLAQLCANHPPTIILDDGSHFAHHVIYTFERMFPSLLPGGIYVVEDLEFHFGENSARWKGKGDYSPPDYFLSIARSRMAYNSLPAESWGTARFIEEQTDAIVFIGGAVLLKKKHQTRDLQGAFRFAEEYLKDHALGTAGIRKLISYVLRHDGPYEEAEKLVLAALRQHGEDLDLVSAFADLCIRQKRFGKPAALVRKAAEQNPRDGALWYRLGLIEKALNEQAAAERAFRNAVSLTNDNFLYQDEFSQILEQQGKYEEALQAVQRAYQLCEGRPMAAAFAKRLQELKRLLAAKGDPAGNDQAR